MNYLDKARADVRALKDSLKEALTVVTATERWLKKYPTAAALRQTHPILEQKAVDQSAQTVSEAYTNARGAIAAMLGGEGEAP